MTRRRPAISAARSVLETCKIITPHSLYSERHRQNPTNMHRSARGKTRKDAPIHLLMHACPHADARMHVIVHTNHRHKHTAVGMSICTHACEQGQRQAQASKALALSDMKEEIQRKNLACLEGKSICRRDEAPFDGRSSPKNGELYQHI